MALEDYRAKRHFNRTAEPKGRAGKRAGAQFVVQKHAASRLHYDFRLELDGVLKSWAVPKGPSLDPRVKALAVHVEDHPLEYASFEGTIPKGEYGGGSVIVWDRGTWEPEGDARRDYATGKLTFQLRGEKLRGGWTLIRMHGKAGADGKNWLLIKHDDSAASDESITEKRPESVISGKTVEEIGDSHDESAGGAKKATKKRATTRLARRTREPRTSGDRKTKNTPRASSRGTARFKSLPTELPGARRAKLPAELSPELATLVDEAPRGGGWVYELKFDGYRLLAYVQNGRVTLRTRAGNDWTDRFPSIAEAIAALGIESGILDGEIVVLAQDGTSDFQALQNVMSAGRDDQLVYFVFDLPYFDGYDLTSVPLLERKAVLKRLLGSEAKKLGAIRYSDHLDADGATVLAHACKGSVEGLVGKQADSPYEQRRTRDWIKLKCKKRQEFVIGGWTDPGGARQGLGALLLGYYDNEKKLHYCGKVGTGFTARTLNELHRKLAPHRAREPAFSNFPGRPSAVHLHWVRPKLVAEVEFGSWTNDGILRHAAFLGLREDKNPTDVKREVAVAPPTVKLRRASHAAASGKSNDPVEELGDLTDRLTHPDRILYPDASITKRSLAEYYIAVADWILPHVVDRPLSIVRCPEGWKGECFFQKHRTDAMPESVQSIKIRGKNAVREWISVKDVAGLVGLVQMGTLEIHPWGSRVENLEAPDRLIFDLDPGEDVSWGDVVNAARELRQRLKDWKLETFVRTTGGKGIHVVVPSVPRATWAEVKSAARGFATMLQNERPDRYIATSSKAKRPGKIFIDYLRNGRGSTAIASYSTRARAGCPIATPLRWSELTAKLNPATFSINTLPSRLSRLKSDPWDGFLDTRQAIPADFINRFGHSL
jgi:bifunctional non-homologous end joining protein LigD